MRWTSRPRIILNRSFPLPTWMISAWDPRWGILHQINKIRFTRFRASRCISKAKIKTRVRAKVRVSFMRSRLNRNQDMLRTARPFLLNRNQATTPILKVPSKTFRALNRTPSTILWADSGTLPDHWSSRSSVRLIERAKVERCVILELYEKEKENRNRNSVNCLIESIGFRGRFWAWLFRRYFLHCRALDATIMSSHFCGGR